MKPVFALLFALSLPALADGTHNHEAAVEPAPHGGILRDAPPFKSELVLNGTTASIYVYDQNLKPATLASQELEGQIRLPKEKKPKTVKFKRSGEAFEAKIPGIDKVHRFDLHVALKEGEKSVTLDFGIDNIH